MCDCVEESIGGSVESVGKAVGDPLVKCWKSVGKAFQKCSVQRKSVSVHFPVRGHKFFFKFFKKFERT